MRTTTRRGLAALFALALVGCNADVSRDEAAISDLMRAMFDRPDAPLDVTPIVVRGDYAVADWTQGEAGGRALLACGAGGWRIVLCAGDALRTEAGLRGVGVPADIAAALARALNDAELRVSADRLEAMASFEGVVRLDQQSP